MDKEKKNIENYEAPYVEMIEVKMEKGYAVSNVGGEDGNESWI